jgi:hypothetical protein
VRDGEDGSGLFGSTHEKPTKACCTDQGGAVDSVHPDTYKARVGSSILPPPTISDQRPDLPRRGIRCNLPAFLDFLGSSITGCMTPKHPEMPPVIRPDGNKMGPE